VTNSKNEITAGCGDTSGVLATLEAEAGRSLDPESSGTA
jgi:hypothetical protein